MLLFIIFIVGFLIGVFWFRHIVMKRLKNIVEGIESGAIQVRKIKHHIIEPDIVHVKFWRQGEQIYAHNADTDEFLAQGTNKTDIIKILNNRWPETNFRANLINLKENNIE